MRMGLLLFLMFAPKVEVEVDWVRHCQLCARFSSFLLLSQPSAQSDVFFLPCPAKLDSLCQTQARVQGLEAATLCALQGLAEVAVFDVLCVGHVFLLIAERGRIQRRWVLRQALPARFVSVYPTGPF